MDPSEAKVSLPKLFLFIQKSGSTRVLSLCSPYIYSVVRLGGGILCFCSSSFVMQKFFIYAILFLSVFFIPFCTERAWALSNFFFNFHICNHVWLGYFLRRSLWHDVMPFFLDDNLCIFFIINFSFNRSRDWVPIFFTSMYKHCNDILKHQNDFEVSLFIWYSFCIHTFALQAKQHRVCEWRVIQRIRETNSPTFNIRLASSWWNVNYLAEKS